MNMVIPKQNNKKIKLEERLIVAFDFNTIHTSEIIEKIQELKGSGVYIKINSALRASGYNLINDIHNLGLKVFADLKLIDIPNTMKMDAQLLSSYNPEILTVMCCAGVDGMQVVKETLPNTKVLGVTVLTSLDAKKCNEIFSFLPEFGILRFARMAKNAHLYGLILSPKEVALVKKEDNLKSLELITPGVRSAWSIVEDDDQSRIMTPLQAIKNGAERVVVGRPIVEAIANNKGMPQNPREAVEWTLKEIQQGLDER